MKSLIIATLAAFAGIAQAQQVDIRNQELGSGTPNSGLLKNEYQLIQNADPWDLQEQIYHVPQYLPGYPTSAVIYPKVITVKCKEVANGKLSCEDFKYQWGRMEYVFIKPIVEKEVPPPVLVCPTPEPQIVWKEAACKKNRE